MKTTEPNKALEPTTVLGTQGCSAADVPSMVVGSALTFGKIMKKQIHLILVMFLCFGMFACRSTPRSKPFTKVSQAELEKRESRLNELNYKRFQEINHSHVYNLKDYPTGDLITWCTRKNELDDIGVGYARLSELSNIEFYFKCDYEKWKIKWFIVSAEKVAPSSIEVDIPSPIVFKDVPDWTPLIPKGFSGDVNPDDILLISMGRLIAESVDGEFQIWGMIRPEKTLKNR